MQVCCWNPSGRVQHSVALALTVLGYVVQTDSSVVSCIARKADQIWFMFPQSLSRWATHKLLPGEHLSTSWQLTVAIRALDKEMLYLLIGSSFNIGFRISDFSQITIVCPGNFSLTPASYKDWLSSPFYSNSLPHFNRTGFHLQRRHCQDIFWSLSTHYASILLQYKEFHITIIYHTNKKKVNESIVVQYRVLRAHRTE